MKVLITGVKGFVGSNLKPYLQGLGFGVTGVSRRKVNNQNIVSYLDLECNLLNRYKAFIHLAGKAHDLKKTSDDKEYFEVNTDLTKSLFDKFLKSECKMFIYISSVKAAVDSLDGILYENVIPKPITAYGRSKLAAEHYLLQSEIPKDKKVYILRPCMIHGPNNKGNLNLLYKVVSKGIPYPLGSFNNKRSFLSIENLCFVIEKLIEQQPKSGVYNIADDAPISSVELVKIISKSLNKKSKILNIPAAIINVLAKIGTYARLPFNEEKLQKLTENFVVSNKKIKSELEINLPISSDLGLLRTFKSFNE